MFVCPTEFSTSLYFLIYNKRKLTMLTFPILQAYNGKVKYLFCLKLF